MNTPKFVKRLGTDGSGCDLILMSDNYVYRYRGTLCLGWLCSYTAWASTLYKLNVDPELT